MMRKLQVLFLSLVIGISVSSCSKEDKGTGIEGKWTYDTYTYTENGEITESDIAYDPHCSDRKYFYFKPGGIFELGWVNLSTNPTEPCKLFSYPGTWKFENNKISTTLDGDTQVSTVTLISVSPKNLVFRYGGAETYYTYTLVKS